MQMVYLLIKYTIFVYIVIISHLLQHLCKVFFTFSVNYIHDLFYSTIILRMYVQQFIKKFRDKHYKIGLMAPQRLRTQAPVILLHHSYYVTSILRDTFMIQDDYWSSRYFCIISKNMEEGQKAKTKKSFPEIPPSDFHFPFI